jgi:hypothetical protein
LIAKYPHDAARNTAARNLLRVLATESDENVSMETKERLAQFGGASFVKACTESCRLTGFRFMPMTLEDLALDVIARVEASTSELA